MASAVDAAPAFPKAEGMSNAISRPRTEHDGGPGFGSVPQPQLRTGSTACTCHVLVLSATRKASRLGIIRAGGPPRPRASRRKVHQRRRLATCRTTLEIGPCYLDRALRLLPVLGGGEASAGGPLFERFDVGLKGGAFSLSKGQLSSLDGRSSAIQSRGGECLTSSHSALRPVQPSRDRWLRYARHRRGSPAGPGALSSQRRF